LSVYTSRLLCRYKQLHGYFLIEKFQFLDVSQVLGMGFFDYNVRTDTLGLDVGIELLPQASGGRGSAGCAGRRPS
jgi:hypothetical protein